MVTTTVSPTAPTRNSALAVQVSDRMPPRMAMAAISAASTSTAMEKETGRNSAAISAAILISATTSSAVGGSCSTLAAMRKAARAKAMAEKARQGIGAGLAQIGHEQDGGEQHAEGPAKPDGERVEAEKEHGARVGEKAHAADRDGGQHEAVEHRRHAPARDEIVLDLEGARADGDEEIERKRHDASCDWASSGRPQPSCSNIASMMTSETKALVTMP